VAGETRQGAAGLIRWAPRLRPQLLRRLYESDARGLRDEELCDDVGLRLYERCRALLLVARRCVLCLECGSELRVAIRGTSACANGTCRWQTDWQAYWESVQRHDASPGRATDAYRAFCEAWPRARDYGAKLVAIDQLIHAFHIDEGKGQAVKSVASKLLEGNKKEVVRFLDALSALDPGAKERWREVMAATIDARIVQAREPE
jgi:hypothetical protein